MSYIVRYWSLTKSTLVGGVMKSQSSRWGRRSDAINYRSVVVEGNGGPSLCGSEILHSPLYPEIFPHCGIHAQALGGTYPGCGLVLTVKQAKDYQEEIIEVGDIVTYTPYRTDKGQELTGRVVIELDDQFDDSGYRLYVVDRSLDLWRSKGSFRVVSKVWSRRDSSSEVESVEG